MSKPLDEILTYKNSDIFQRYQRDYPNNKLSAEQAMQEMIKYLWLGQKHHIDQQAFPADEELNFVCSMYPEMREIDDMWHTFLLFTKDYMDFCMHYFGEFMHHTPKTDATEPTAEIFEIEFTRYLNYVYDHLGEQSLRIWFPDLVE